MKFDNLILYSFVVSAPTSWWLKIKKCHNIFQNNVVDLPWSWWVWIRTISELSCPNCLPNCNILAHSALVVDLPVCEVQHASTALFKSWVKDLAWFFPSCGFLFCVFEISHQVLSRLSTVSVEALTKFFSNALQGLKFSLWNNDKAWHTIK